MTLRILTYAAIDPDTPSSMCALARLLITTVTQKGNVVQEIHPVIFAGPTVSHVETAAQAWYDAEVEKAAHKKPRGRKPKASAPVVTPDDDIDFIL